MDFGFDDTQQAVARLAGDVLAGQADPESAWKALAQAGLLALAVPEWLGGDGLGPVEVAVLLAETGRVAAPLPVLETLALGVLPLARHGTGDQCERLLDGVVAGNRVLTAGTRGEVTVSGGRVSGTLVGVRYAQRAHRVLVPAGEHVYLVDPADATLTATGTSGGEPECTVTVRGVAAERVDGAAADLRRLALAGACALGGGLVAGALALTAGHVRGREQFGRPLAAFQAVAQRIADVYVGVRTLHLATWSACWRLGAGRDADLDAGRDADADADADLDVAAYWLAQEAPPVMDACHHLHGGLGVDAGYPLHRFSSATKDLVRFVGGVEHRLARLADRIAG